MDDRRRELLTTAFEKEGDQWVWYANAFAKGVPVSTEERELYLDFNPIGFRRAVRGRAASQPRRPYIRGLKRILVAIFLGRSDQGVDPRRL